MIDLGKIEILQDARDQYRYQVFDRLNQLVVMEVYRVKDKNGVVNYAIVDVRHREHVILAEVPTKNYLKGLPGEVVMNYIDKMMCQTCMMEWGPVCNSCLMDSGDQLYRTFRELERMEDEPVGQDEEAA